MPEFLALSHRWHEEERRKDSRTALVAFVTATALGAKAKNGSALKVADFMPGEKHETEGDEMTAEQIEAVLMSMVNQP